RHAFRWLARGTHSVPSDRSTATDGSVALVSELGDTCRVKLVVSAANACSDSSRVDGGGKRYTVAMTAAASRMGALRKEMATMPSGGLALFGRVCEQQHGRDANSSATGCMTLLLPS